MVKIVKKSDLKFQVALLLFAISVLTMTSVEIGSRQSIRNFAKEPTTSEQSGQLAPSTSTFPRLPGSLNPISPSTSPSSSTPSRFSSLATAKNLAVRVNNGTSSLLQTILAYLVGGVLFVGIFYLLVKKFL